MSVKGGRGVPPKSVTFFCAKILFVNGGGTPLTDKIRKVVFDVLPKRLISMTVADVCKALIDPIL